MHAQVETKKGEEESSVELPPFLDVVRRLENNPEDERMYGAYSLSLMDNEEESK